MPEGRVTRYFSNAYPDRQPRPSPVARKGEDQRAAFMREHVGTEQIGTLLDIGCGDGKFISDLFNHTDSTMTLSDLSQRFVDQAESRLCGRPNTLFHTGDGFEIIAKTNFDFIAAIGVFDYWADWRDRLALLMAQRQATIVLSVPRLRSFRQLARLVWLKNHGIGLQTVGRYELVTLLQTGGRSYTLDVVGDDFMVYLPGSDQ